MGFDLYLWIKLHYLHLIRPIYGSHYFILKIPASRLVIHFSKPQVMVSVYITSYVIKEEFIFFVRWLVLLLPLVDALDPELASVGKVPLLFLFLCIGNAGMKVVFISSFSNSGELWFFSFFCFLVCFLSLAVWLLMCSGSNASFVGYCSSN